MDLNIFKLVSELPLWFQIIIILLIILLTFANKLKDIKALFKKPKTDKSFTRREVTINSKTDLINHPIFSKLEHFLDHEIRMMNFGDSKRNRVFRCILSAQFAAYNANLYHLATHTSLEKLTSSELQSLVFETYNTIINDYNSKVADSLGAELFDLIMNNEVKGYNAWHEPVLQMVKSGIDDILTDEIYDNNYEKLYSVLNKYKNSLKSVKMNVENTYRNFNGDLDRVLKNTTF